MKNLKVLMLAAALTISFAGIILIYKASSTASSPALGVVLLVLGVLFLIFGLKINRNIN